jgi:hypothetical protein
MVSQLGGSLKVQVRAAATGFVTSAYVSSAAATIATGSFVEPAPTISGTPQLGATLTAGHTGWSPTSGAVFHYQWYRATASDGSDAALITGATAATHVVVAADAESVLLVHVWATASGYQPSDEVASASTAKVMSPVSVVVSGSTKHGSTLTAALSSPDPVATATYQWYYVYGASLVAISGATHPTYTISSSYLGRQLRVRVTVTAIGYATSSTYSAATGKVT